MMRLLASLAWLRWRILVNSIVRRRKGSRGQRLSGWMSAGSTALIVGFGLLIGGALAAGGFFGGMMALRDESSRATIGLVLRMLGLSSLLMALVTPLQAASDGSAPTRLLLLPIPLRRLHVAGILASAADPLVLMVAPAVLALLVGMAAAGGMTAALLTLPSALALIAFLIGFGALVGLGSQLLLRDRRRGEMMALLLLLAVIAAGFLPAVMASRLDPDRSTEGEAVARPEPGIADIERGFGLLDAAPPGLFARALQRSLDQRPASALLHALPIAGCAAACLWAASRVHARLLGDPARSSRRLARAAFPKRILAPWPLDPRTLAAAGIATRIALRTVRGKLAVFTPALVAGVMALVFRGLGDEAALVGASMSTEAGLLSWSTALVLLNLQPLVLNVHATDRAGFTLLALLPCTERQIVRGKMLAYGALFGLALLPALPVALVMGSPSPASAWLAAGLAALAAWMLLAPISVLLSAWFPKSADLSRLSGQQPHAAATVLGMLAVLVALLLPRLAGFAGNALAGGAGEVTAVTACCVGALLLSIPLGRLAATELGAHRESIAMAAESR